jgi:tripartite-type tricarboxylate transporter receptor subunit TctC
MRQLTLAAGTFAAALLANAVAMAEVYPSHPITIVVPFPPGGTTDVIARILAEHMKSSLGQPLVIENAAGAGGSLGVARAARATPDGYTLSLGQWSSHIGTGAIYPVHYDVLKDFAPISLLATAPLWIVARKDFPAEDLGDLVGWLKANPDKATAGTIGIGSAPHICAIYLQQATGARFQTVPYRGGALELQDLLAGHIDFSCDVGPNSLAQVRAGQLKAYAIIGKYHWFADREVHTIDEEGFPGVHISFWHALWAPAGTPKAVVAMLNRATRDALADPVVRQRFAELGQEIPTPEEQSPEWLASYQEAEIVKWWPIIKAANIRASE